MSPVPTDLTPLAVKDEGELWCPRCDDNVRAIRPWRWWKSLWLLWKVAFVAMLCAFPIIAADYCVMLPSTMLFLVGGGLLRGYAREKPVCRKCSLELDGAPEPAGTFQPPPPA